MKRLIVKILLIIVQRLLVLVSFATRSEIQAIIYTSIRDSLEIQLWGKPDFLEWKEFKNCHYRDQLTEEVIITYWDIEEDFNTMKGVKYNE